MSTVNYNRVAAETVPSIVRDNGMAGSFITGLSIGKPEVRNDLIKRFGNQKIKGLIDIAELIGAKAPVARETFEHWEEDRINQPLTFTKTGGGNFATSGHSNEDFTVSAENGAANNYLRVGDVIRFAVGDFTAVVTGVSAQTFTARPYGTGWRFPANTTTTRAILQAREALQGGSTPTQSISPKVWKYENSMMIIDEVFIAEGGAMTDQIWFEVTDADGRSLGYKWTAKGSADTDVRFENYKEMQFLNGEKASGDTATAGYSGFRGLLEDIRSYGINANKGSNPITLSFMDSITRRLEKNRAGREYVWLAGFDQHTQISDMLASVTNMGIGGTNFGSFSNSEDMFQVLDFTGFQRNGFKFAVRNYEAYNIDGLLGTDGFNYMNRGIILPMDSTVNPKDRSQVYRSFELKYKALEGYSRELEVWMTGAVNGTYTNKTDKLEVNYRSHVGFEAFGINRFVEVK